MKGLFDLMPARIGIIVICLAGFLACGKEAVPFTKGFEVVAAPEGDLAAIGEERGAWTILTPEGASLCRFDAMHPPLWLLDGTGRSLIFAGKDGLRIIDIDKSSSSRLLISGVAVRPVEALSNGRILVAFLQGSGIHGFCIIEPFQMAPEAPFPEPHPIVGSPAVLLRASRDGHEISYAIRNESLFRIVVLARSSDKESYQERFAIEDANFPEHFWSPSGGQLLFSSHYGGVEIYELGSDTRRWIKKGSFAPSIVPFRAHFSPDGSRVYMEMTDEHGFRQISTYDIKTGRETRFTSGWLDHYGPVLSRNGRYIAYRQGDLKKASEGSGTFETEESLYIWDFIGGSSMHPCDRAMMGGSDLIGPVFSGDSRFLYYGSDGHMFKYPLIK